MVFSTTAKPLPEIDFVLGNSITIEFAAGIASTRYTPSTSLLKFLITTISSSAKSCLPVKVTTLVEFKLLDSSLTNPGTDVLVFNTPDGGTTWRGNIFGKDIK